MRRTMPSGRVNGLPVTLLPVVLVNHLCIVFVAIASFLEEWMVCHAILCIYDRKQRV
jgi:hypothetical protein